MNKKASVMGDWIPLYISLFLILILGGLIPPIIESVVDTSQPANGPVVNSILHFINNGFTILEFNNENNWLVAWFNNATGLNVGTKGIKLFNPFDMLGQETKDFIIKELNALSYLPSYIGIPVVMIILLGFVYTGVKLLRG